MPSLRIPRLLLTLLGLSLMASPPAHANARLCRDLFQLHLSHTTTKKVDKVFTTQSAIGRVYAEVKLLEKSGLGKYKRVSDISGKDLKALKEFVHELLKDPLPAVLSPSGDVFIIDGHHDLYVVVLLGYKLENTKVAVRIVKDYTADKFTEDQFHQDLVAREWADLDSVQKKPKLISELQDSPERSLAGLSFLYIVKHFGVSMTGKHFVPRVQFKLIDLIKKEKLFDFDPVLGDRIPDDSKIDDENLNVENLSAERVENFAQLIVTSPIILDFLIHSLAPNASKTLRQFLNEKRQESDPN